MFIILQNIKIKLNAKNILKKFILFFRVFHKLKKINFILLQIKKIKNNFFRLK